MKYIALIAAIVCLLVMTSPAGAQHVRTYKNQFPGYCMPGPTAY